MPRSIIDLKSSENEEHITQRIINFLKSDRSNAFTLNEVETGLRKNKELYGTIGGDFYLVFLLHKLISKGIIKNIISDGKEYFFIE